MAKLLLFLLSLPSALAISGYPAKGIEITSNKVAIISNSFCFPVVVTVNARDYEVPSFSTKILSTTQWSRWTWMPGTLGSGDKKNVLNPFKPPGKVRFGEDMGETHRGPDKYGYDFIAPLHTPVYAMEDGIVARVIDHYLEAHQDKKRKDENNVIEVVHADGTVARYSHLHPKSALVRPCDKIKAGDQLAQSGNTGYSSGPHLHVDIYRPRSGESYTTLPLTFR